MIRCSQESPSPPRPGGCFLLFCSVRGHPGCSTRTPCRPAHQRLQQGLPTGVTNWQNLPPRGGTRGPAGGAPPPELGLGTSGLGPEHLHLYQVPRWCQAAGPGTPH